MAIARQCCGCYLLEHAGNFEKKNLPMTPRYQKVKDHILAHIGSGAWPSGHRVPSENELVRLLGVSRMTVNRAMREMADEGLLVRVAGVGTFVADRTAHAHPLEVHNIADEIRSRGHVHRAEVLKLEAIEAKGDVAESFGVRPGARLFHSVIVHFENDLPVQLEDRHVNPAIAPDYLSVDFTQATPHEYLIQASPLQEVEHILRATMPKAQIRKLLKMPEDEPCLLLQRRTWSKGVVATISRFYYPASRYEFSGRFKP